MMSFSKPEYTSEWDRIYHTEAIDADIYNLDDDTFDNWSGEVASWNYDENTKFENSLRDLDIYMKEHRQYIAKQRKRSE